LEERRPPWPLWLTARPLTARSLTRRGLPRPAWLRRRPPLRQEASGNRRTDARSDGCPRPIPTDWSPDDPPNCPCGAPGARGGQELRLSLAWVPRRRPVRCESTTKERRARSRTGARRRQAGALFGFWSSGLHSPCAADRPPAGSMTRGHPEAPRPQAVEGAVSSKPAPDAPDNRTPRSK
jgi:hypothetical protein